MTNFKQLANLDELKQMAGGNPMKMATYSIAKRELEQLKAEHFNEDHPFVNGFSHYLLDELKVFAENNPNDESAQIRYQLQKERYAVQEAGKTAHIDKRLVKGDIRAKLQAGGLTYADLKAAQHLAKTNSSPENLTLYSLVKRQLEAAEQAPEAE